MEEPKFYSIEKLSESNYHSRSQVIESHLNDQDLWKIVKRDDKKSERPSTSITSTPQSSEQATMMEEYETELKTWTKKTKKIQKMIISTISPSIMIYVEDIRDPAEMWTILEGRYKPKTHVILYQLQCQFNMIKIIDDDDDMKKHLQQIEWFKW